MRFTGPIVTTCALFLVLLHPAGLVAYATTASSAPACDNKVATGQSCLGVEYGCSANDISVSERPPPHIVTHVELRTARLESYVGGKGHALARGQEYERERQKREIVCHEAGTTCYFSVLFEGACGAVSNSERFLTNSTPESDVKSDDTVPSFSFQQALRGLCELCGRDS